METAPPSHEEPKSPEYYPQEIIWEILYFDQERYQNLSNSFFRRLVHQRKRNQNLKFGKTAQPRRLNPPEERCDPFYEDHIRRQSKFVISYEKEIETRSRLLLDRDHEHIILPICREYIGIFDEKGRLLEVVPQSDLSPHPIIPLYEALQFDQNIREVFTDPKDIPFVQNKHIPSYPAYISTIKGAQKKQIRPYPPLIREVDTILNLKSLEHLSKRTDYDLTQLPLRAIEAVLQYAYEKSHRKEFHQHCPLHHATAIRGEKKEHYMIAFEALRYGLEPEQLCELSFEPNIWPIFRLFAQTFYTVDNTARELSFHFPTRRIDEFRFLILRRGVDIFRRAHQNLREERYGSPISSPRPFIDLIEKEEMAVKKSLKTCTEIAKTAKSNPSQKALLEKRFEEIFVEYQIPKIPREQLTKCLQAEKQEVEIPESKTPYFPLGITRKLDRFQDYSKNPEGRITKPIDIYSYLFWLNNLGHPVDLVICDRMQETNFQLLHPDRLHPLFPATTARVNAAIIGRSEFKFYQHAIKQFGLTNIRLRSYDFLARKEAFKDRLALCEKLKDHPRFKTAFELLTQRIIGKKFEDTPDKLEKLRQYALTEIAWILSHDQLKITHPNEAAIGYDPLACVIKNIEKEAERLDLKIECHWLEIKISLDEPIDIFAPKFAPLLEKLLSRVLLKLDQEILNKNKLVSSQDKKYFMEFRKFLFGENKGKNSTNGAFGSAGRFCQRQKPGKNKSTHIHFPFHCPATISSQSYGLRNTKTQEEVISFKEPYSTYFYTTTSAKEFFESEQIMAAPEKDIYVGVFLTLPAKKQLEYFDTTIAPLLSQFFIYLDSAPPSYFQSVRKDNASIKEEFQNIFTTSDAIEFVRKYIISPSLKN